MDTSIITSAPFDADHWLSVLGALVTITSTVASLVNHRVRGQLDAGTDPKKSLLALGSVLNFAAVNFDKGLQLLRMFKGVGAGTGTGAGAAPGAPVVDPATPVAPETCPTCGRAS